jgi:membrane fusion protein, multidrug efflux system
MNANASISLAVALALCAGCRAKPSAAPAPGPVEVGVVRLAPSAVTLTRELPGRTSAFRVAEVRARVNGIVLKRRFTEGSDVKQGQPPGPPWRVPRRTWSTPGCRRSASGSWSPTTP